MPRRLDSETSATDEPNSRSQAWNRWIGCAPKGFGHIPSCWTVWLVFLDVLEEPPTNAVSVMDSYPLELSIERRSNQSSPSGDDSLQRLQGT